jgi:hypothetical protein
MGLYNFQERFVPKIMRGEKTHTIRAKRRNPDKPGNTLHLYVGLRRRGAALLMRVPCAKVEHIRIRRRPQGVYIEGQLLSADECELLAQRDGFTHFAEMMEFWRGRLPFEGNIIHWKYPHA